MPTIKGHQEDNTMIILTTPAGANAAVGAGLEAVAQHSLARLEHLSVTTRDSFPQCIGPYQLDN
jgi:hypothetical protein